MNIDTKHIGILYFADENKNGKFTRKKIEKFWNFFNKLAYKYHQFEMSF